MKKNLVFTSAGDVTEFYKLWFDEHRNYDIYIYYYGNDNSNKYIEYCDYYKKEKGSKFQNFYKLWNDNEQKFIRDYERILIIDDDIIMSTDDINILFEYSEYYNLWILQPSFDNINDNCIISHPITEKNNYYIFRYTNFIEVNTMLFSNYAIKKCMEIYDPILVGFGIDWLFLWYLGKDKKKYAIIDSISCVNPKNKNTDKREIEKLQSNETRLYNWNYIRKKYNIDLWEHKNYSGIRLKNM